jgi:GTP-binding protein
MIKRDDLRNIAIIAHVDHGKTTLVDQMLKQGGIYRKNQQVAERVMDSGELERERGITIMAKNTSVYWNSTKINIVDTPGHADFSGEVERILKMVDGALLLVDASEGPMPQTRFVLQRALEMKLPIIICINKVDRPDRRISDVIDEILTLLIDLKAGERQLECPIVYCSGRNGTASLAEDGQGEDLRVLFETILEYIPAPEGDEEGPFQMLVSSISYNDYTGREAIGSIERGRIRSGSELAIASHGKAYRAKATSLYQIEGLKKKPAEEAMVGDIICLSGIPEITIGDTVCDPSKVEAIPFVKISEPTIEMDFAVNDSPLAGREGKFVTSQQLRERLFRELLRDVSLRVSDTDSPSRYTVTGRGEMHLSVLIETMRREGYEFAVGKPKAIIRVEGGVKTEPMEALICDVPKEFVGTVIDRLSSRKGEMVLMQPLENRVRMEFSIPSRGLLGYRAQFLEDTRGEGVMNSVFDGYSPYKGDVETFRGGALVASEAGETTPYGLFNSQERGSLFVGVGATVYEGMVVGVSPKPEDIVVNVCKKKHVTNIRAAGSDENLRITPALALSLEECLGFIGDDESLEATPKNLRLRKNILDKSMRLREQSHKKAQK